MGTQGKGLSYKCKPGLQAKHSWNWGHKAITGLGLRRFSAFLAPWRPKDVGLCSAERGQLPAGTVDTTGCVSGKEHVLLPDPGWQKRQRI